MVDNYKIDTDIILKKILYILSIQKKYNNYKIGEKDLFTLTNMLINLGANVPLEANESLKDILAIDTGEIENYRNSYKIIKFLYNNLDIDSYVPTYSSYTMSNHDALEESTHFFKQYDGIFVKALNSYYKDSNFHLEFNDNVINSETYFLDKGKETYVLVKNYHNICKFTNLIHELQHCIDNYINSSFKNNYLIRETAALFMEMLASDYISKVTELHKDGFERRRELHSIISVTVFNLYHKTQMLSIAQKNMEKSSDEISNLIREKLHISKLGIEILTKTTLVEDYMYEVAYLIAIELYTIYSDDQEKAIYILKNIIMYGNDDNIFQLLNKYGIRICQNVMKYEKKLFS